MTNALNTITVDGVTYNYDAYSASQPKNTIKNEMDKDAFLNLLVTQLRYQDPLEPQDNSEFVAEMAQFSTLEQMNNMSDTLAELNKLVSNIDTSVLVGQLSGMIGKGVDWLETTNYADEEGNPQTSTETLSGIITGVTVADGTTKVIVESDGQTYQVDIADVAYVYEPDNKTLPTQIPAQTVSTDTSTANALIM